MRKILCTVDMMAEVADIMVKVKNMDFFNEISFFDRFQREM